MMILQVAPDSPIPLYAQLVDQIRREIATGSLAPGAALPTVRQLAVDLRINMHTVARAYAELAREGLIDMRRGVGTTVQRAPRPPGPDEQAHRLAELVREAVGRAAALGVTPEQFGAAVQEHIRRRS